ncbi:MAG: hypothetical protein NVS2B16_19370 [Chloroflexota bacterium]
MVAEKGPLVKALATVFTVLIVLGAGLVRDSVSAQQVHRSAGRAHLFTLQSSRIALFAYLSRGNRGRREQTGPVPTATLPAATATLPAATATPVATISPYPDPQPILQSTFNVYSQITRAHFDYLTTGEQTGVEKLNVDAAGDATCKGPAYAAHVTAKDVRQAQTTSLKVKFIVVKKLAFKKGKATKNKWAKIKPSQVKVFGITVDQPLNCATAPATSGGSGSSNNVSIKDVVNLGPGTFNGEAVWHLRATEVATDATGAQQSAQLDFLISQKGSLPYVFSLTEADPTHNVTLSQRQTLTKFQEKITIKAPKVG